MAPVNGFIVGGLLGAVIAAFALIAGCGLSSVAVRRALGVLASLVLMISLGATFFGYWLASGDRSPIAAYEITDGVMYERLLIDDAVAHLMSFDLSNPCLALTTTAVRPDGSVDALRTTAWAEQEGAVAAINSNYFFPYDAGWPWGDPTPVEGGEVNILGTVKRDGEEPISASSEFGRVRHRVWIDADNVGHVGLELADDAVVAVTGRELILESGQVVGHESDNYPRTVVGIAEDTSQMWWLVVDGKRPGYSVGVTFDEAAEFLASVGATDAVALDGGGSTTMVANGGDGVQMLNLTRNQGIPNRERPIANHLGLVPVAGCS